MHDIVIFRRNISVHYSKKILHQDRLRTLFYPVVMQLRFPRSFSTSTHASLHWTFERALSLTTLGLVTSAFALYPNHAVDFCLGFTLPLHSHIGFSAIITDYIPQRKFPRIYPLAMGSLYMLTGLTMYGLYAVNTEGPGISEGLATIWKAIGKKDGKKEEHD